MNIRGIANLVIEVTRKCNLQCAHCLRGEAQDIEISEAVIDKIFHDLSGV